MKNNCLTQDNYKIVDQFWKACWLLLGSTQLYYEYVTKLQGVLAWNTSLWVLHTDCFVEKRRWTEVPGA